MNEFQRQVLNGVRIAVASAWLAGCAGTTSVQQNHPLFASADATDKAMVYLLRPDPGFRGVMDRPLTVSLGGTEMLGLAKGQYTLVFLKPGSAEMKLDFYTVVGPSNAMTAVSTRTQLTFSPGATQYLVFELASRGFGAGSEFVPRALSREQALEVSKALGPVGMAVGEPLR